MDKKILYIGLLLLSTSCRSIKYVPIETTHTEYRDRIVKDSSDTKEELNIRDSVICRDSVVNIVDERGNVIRKEVYKWREKYHERNYLLKALQAKYDSLLSAKQKVINVPYPVEKQLTKWQKIKIELGGWAFGAIILLIIMLGWYIRKK